MLATLTRLKQVCNHPAQFLGDGSALAGRSGKLDRLPEMLEEVLAEGDRALVFTQFAQMGRVLREYLAGAVRAARCCFSMAALPAEQRDHDGGALPGARSVRRSSFSRCEPAAPG